MKLLITCIIFSTAFTGLTQNYGIETFTGLTWHKEGIGFKKFDIELDGQTWTGNRLPINKEFTIRMIEPTGFVVSNDECSPGIEVTIVNTKGDTLGHAPNIFGADMETMTASMLSKLTLQLTYNELSKPGDTNIVIARFFDQKSTRQTTIRFPMVIAPQYEPLQRTNNTSSYKSWKGYEVKTTGIEMDAVETYMDSLLLPLKWQHTIRLVKMKDVTKEELRDGKYSVEVYDEQFNLVPPFMNMLQLAVKSPEDDEKINQLYKVALDPKQADIWNYTVRVRWQSADASKVIDVISKLQKP